MNNQMDIKNVSLQFPYAESKALSHISLSLKKGDQLVLLGGNGSGKSSLIRLMNRMQTPSSGEIFFDSEPIQKIENALFSKKVMTITQDLRDALFYDLTVSENIELWGSRFSEKEHSIDLDEYHPHLKKRVNTPVAKLSGGEKQSLLLALCLRHPPELLLLDEHTSALDPKLTPDLLKKTFQAIEENKITCVMCTHDLSMALAYGNRLIILSSGEIVFSADEKEKKQLSKEHLLAFY